MRETDLIAKVPIATVGTLFALVMFPCLAAAQSPPPPTPVAPTRVEKPGTTSEDAYLRLANNSGDVILIESGHMKDGRLGHLGSVDSSSGPRRLVLEDGTPLVVDDRSPAGTFQLEDGRQVTVSPRLGYPRYYSITDEPRWAIIFEGASAEDIGALAFHDTSAASPSRDPARWTEILARIRSPRPEDTFYPVLVSGKAAKERAREEAIPMRTTATVTHRESNRAAVYVSPRRPAPVRVVWFAGDVREGDSRKDRICRPIGDVLLDPSSPDFLQSAEAAR